MGEFSKQIQKYRKEKDSLEDLIRRMSRRASELTKRIQALELLDNEESELGIPAEVLKALDKHLRNNGESQSPHLILSDPPYAIDPSQKSHIVLSVMYREQRGEMTSSQVFDAVRNSGYGLSKQDIYKVLSRFVKMGRLEKSESGGFALTDAGVRTVKILDSEAHLVKLDR